MTHVDFVGVGLCVLSFLYAFGGAALGVGVQLYSNAVRKLPLMRCTLLLNASSVRLWRRSVLRVLTARALGFSSSAYCARELRGVGLNVQRRCVVRLLAYVI